MIQNTTEMRNSFICILGWCLFQLAGSYRILQSGKITPDGAYFRPFDKGFVGVYGDPSNLQRERINEGAFETPSQELLFEGVSPRQVCPNMVGPFSDGNYYCSAREYGYCDRRSGTCFCNTGYQGIDCSECQASHFLIGSLCFPKKLCPKDCSGSGTCDYNSGTCTCLPHRYGSSCENMLCSSFSPLCEACTQNECLLCSTGYYLTLDSRVCSSCYDFDPRCAGCTKDLGCTVCADPILTSVRRSGYRSSDPKLPVEEDTREFSITLPFGTKSPESFADAENFFVCTDQDNPLYVNSKTCSQGPEDDSWKCKTFQASHRVCGHLGVFKFAYPNYVVKEKDKYIRMSVERSGGGYGNISINYFINHISTNDSDVSATAPYTTLQTLSFDDGIVQREFLIYILDDYLTEGNEVFQVVLETPVGGGSIGAQFRTNVTIIDDDIVNLSPKLTKPLQSSAVTKAGTPFNILIQGTGSNGVNLTTGGELFVAIVENDVEMWSQPDRISPRPYTGRNILGSGQRNSRRLQCNVTDNYDGTYTVSGNIKEQGNYQLRTFHAFPGGLRGQYYSDAFFETLALERLDRQVNFTWGTGRIIPRGTDYISIRWSGAIDPPVAGLYFFKVEAQDHVRLWVDGDLVLDHFHLQGANLQPPRRKMLKAHVLTEVVLEYRKVRGAAHARLMWATPLDPTLHVIPYSSLYALYDIAFNPVAVRVQSAVSASITTECTGAGLYAAEAMVRSSFTVCPRDRFGNLRDDDDEFYLSSELFSASLVLGSTLGSNGQGTELITPVLKYNHETHCFDGSYTPNIAGSYLLNVYYQSWHDAVLEHVAGSPFALIVQPTKAFGPYSNVLNLPNPLTLQAGKCFNFTIVSRDSSRNLRLRGKDSFIVYMYQVSYYTDFAGPAVPTAVAGGLPTATPVAMPTASPFAQYTRYLPLSDSPQSAVRDGIVSDLGNGNYSVMVCPVITGWYELHVLLHGKGVSNQPNRVMDFQQSLLDSNLGRGSYAGQYVDGSPYSLIVSHSTASAFACTAEGPGLLSAVTGVTTWFIITVRDAWGNTLRTSSPAAVITVNMENSPTATNTVNIWNYRNGSYNIRYTADLTGVNSISVTVDGVQIPNSPFKVPTSDGRVTSQYSYAVGPGLQVGTTGVEQYFEVFAFDLDGNRKTVSTDRFAFTVVGVNNISVTALAPCPRPPSDATPMCNPVDSATNPGGHYFGRFTPLFAGAITVHVYLVDPTTAALQELANSPFHATIHESAAVASSTVISGDIYNQMAGNDSYVSLKMFDRWHNKVTSGGDAIELVLLGVAVEWGTIMPWGTTPGLPNAHHYRGFYAGYPDVYGQVADRQDGDYIIRYNAPKAGQYVMRISLAEPGLNATYFNGTALGHLFDGDHTLPGIQASRDYIPVNFGTTISWTGDIGGRPGVQGDRGLSGSYWERFASRVDATVDLNLTASNPKMKNESEAAVRTQFKFREQFWSARWVGMVTPLFAERYNFTVLMDAESSVKLSVGGVGTMLNGSQPGSVVIEAKFSSSASGQFSFSDSRSREFVLEYIHFTGSSQLQLFWESPSTPFSLVPASAFSHWTNISHYNTTIHPAPLCPHCSTVYGEGLSHAVVGSLASFVLYARDSFDNLLQRGGDVPTAMLVGRDGTLCRADVLDYGNSTYLLSYNALVAGDYLLYVTVGCCVPHPNIGLSAEMEASQKLLVKGAPFSVRVDSAAVEWSRTIATGQGTVGGVVGQNKVFEVLFRDAYNNPTTVPLPEKDALIRVTFTDQYDHMVVSPDSLQYRILPDRIVATYNLTRAGTYVMDVEFQVPHVTRPASAQLSEVSVPVFVHIAASPFIVVMTPQLSYPPLTVLKGIGYRQATKGRPASFMVHLYDRFNNHLTVGGTRLFVRVLGDGHFSGPAPVVPVCKDLANGQMLCTYTSVNSGPHTVVVKVVNATADRAGGSGLKASYFTSPEATVSLDPRLLPPLTEEIDPVIDRSWPGGFLVPNVVDMESPGGFIPTHGTGQSVVWQGYLVSPLSDSYSLTLSTVNLMGSITIDGQLVFTSDGRVNEALYLQENSVYAIIVRVWIPPTDNFNRPASVAMHWATVNMSPRLVPGYYLYDSAQEIPLSPFPVDVSP